MTIDSLWLQDQEHSSSDIKLYYLASLLITMVNCSLPSYCEASHPSLSDADK